MTDETSGIHLNYGHEASWWQRFSTTASAFFRESFDGIWKFVGYFWGMAAHYAGGTAQLIFALGVAFLAGGFGLAIERSEGGTGHFWMWIGGLLVGLVVRIPQSGAPK
jgi:hypothetical protein